MLLLTGIMMRLADFLFRDSPPDIRQRKLRVLLIVVVAWILVSCTLVGILLIFNKPIFR